MAGERGRSSSRGSDDPVDRLAKMIDERITAAFDSRDKRQREESDPWARLEGLIDRAVEAGLERRLGDLLDDEDDDEGEPQPRGRRPAGKDKDSPLSLFG